MQTIGCHGETEVFNAPLQIDRIPKRFHCPWRTGFVEKENGYFNFVIREIHVLLSSGFISRHREKLLVRCFLQKQIACNVLLGNVRRSRHHSTGCATRRLLRRISK